jgi:hypothetical protein
MGRRGLLLTMTEPPPRMEEEFNAWYDLEHLPERLSIPGFRSARRWVADCAPGDGKYLATYELESLDVLSSAQYLSFFKKPTPWTKRCLDATVVFKRWACEQLEPGDAESHPAANAVLLLGGSTPLTVTRDALLRRVFKASSGDPAHIVLLDLADGSDQPLPAAPLARLYRAYG